MRKMNKTEISFFKKDDAIYMFVLETASGRIVLKEMSGNGRHIDVSKEEFNDYKHLTEDEVYLITENMSDDEYHKFMGHIGAYTCPFCGGKLHWESDFMTSEVHGLEHGYYKVTDEDEINYLN